MLKVLIYSSKEIYNNASYEGRSEADIVAYALDEHFYQVVKNRHTSVYFPFSNKDSLSDYLGKVHKRILKRHIDRLEIKVN